MRATESSAALVGHGPRIQKSRPKTQHGRHSNFVTVEGKGSQKPNTQHTIDLGDKFFCGPSLVWAANMFSTPSGGRRQKPFRRVTGDIGRRFIFFDAQTLGFNSRTSSSRRKHFRRPECRTSKIQSWASISSVTQNTLPCSASSYISLHLVTISYSLSQLLTNLFIFSYNLFQLLTTSYSCLQFFTAYV